MSDKEKVKDVYWSADVWYGPVKKTYRIYEADKDGDAGEPLSDAFPTEAEAWADAVRRLDGAPMRDKDGNRLLWVIEVTWKRRKDTPVEAVAITTGRMLQAICLSEEVAKRLKVPGSWVAPVLYTRSTKKGAQ